MMLSFDAAWWKKKSNALVKLLCEDKYLCLARTAPVLAQFLRAREALK
jgi:hypothetical protein